MRARSFPSGDGPPRPAIALLAVTGSVTLLLSVHPVEARDRTQPPASPPAHAAPAQPEAPAAAPAEAPADTTTGSPPPAVAASPVDDSSPDDGAPATPPATVPLDSDAAASLEAVSDGPVVLEGGLSVDITRDQHASIVGDSASLHAVIVEICRQAGIELRAYAAPDRRYVGRLENVPLADALRSMLKAESYLVGFRAGKSGRQYITWLRVLGGKDGAGAPPIAGAPFAQPRPAPVAAPAPNAEQKFIVSSSLLFQAFGTFDPQRREQAQREILTRIGDPEQLPRFLATDPKELAKMFGRYRGSADTLRRLQGMADRPEVQTKIAEILSEVEKTEQQP
jgi:hypothetical protein